MERNRVRINLPASLNLGKSVVQKINENKMCRSFELIMRILHVRRLPNMIVDAGQLRIDSHKMC